MQSSNTFKNLKFYFIATSRFFLHVRTHFHTFHSLKIFFSYKLANTIHSALIEILNFVACKRGRNKGRHCISSFFYCIAYIHVTLFQSYSACFSCFEISLRTSRFFNAKSCRKYATEVYHFGLGQEYSCYRFIYGSV